MEDFNAYKNIYDHRKDWKISTSTIHKNSTSKIVCFVSRADERGWQGVHFYPAINKRPALTSKKLLTPPWLPTQRISDDLFLHLSVFIEYEVNLFSLVKIFWSSLWHYDQNQNKSPGINICPRPVFSLDSPVCFIHTQFVSLPIIHFWDRQHQIQNKNQKIFYNSSKFMPRLWTFNTEEE